MKLDRNTNTTSRGKYALIKLRVARPVEWSSGEVYQIHKDAVDFGSTEETEFFVIRLKDQFAESALRGYASAISDYLASLPSGHPGGAESLAEYHREIIGMAEAAHRNPHRRIPD